MNLSAIKALMAAMAESGLAEMTYSEDGWTLRLVRDPAATGAAPQAEAAEVRTHSAPLPFPEAPAQPPGVLEAPLAGIVHFRPAPDAAPFVEVGSKVGAGDPLCVIEAMKVFNTVRAEHAGVVAGILVASGSEVEAGQPLLRLA